MYILGITGGICSGKSTIAKILHDDYHVPVIDADKFGHMAYLNAIMKSSINLEEISFIVKMTKLTAITVGLRQ